MSDIEVADLILKEAGLVRWPLTQVEFDFDGQKRSVYIPEKPGKALSEEDLEDAYEMLKIADMARSAPFYEDWKEDSRHILERLFVESGAADRLMIGIWVATLERWQREIQKISEDDQYQRFRRFKPELIRYDARNDTHIVQVDANALVMFMEKCPFTQEREIINRWVNYAFDLILTYALQDVLETPEQNKKYHPKIRLWAAEYGKPEPTEKDFEWGGYAYQYIVMLRLSDAISNFSTSDLDSVISGFVSQISAVASQVGTLSQIENRVLGFISYSLDDGNEPISMGDIPVAINEGLVGALEKSWQTNQDGELYYATMPSKDSLTVKMKILQKSDDALRAEQSLEFIDPLAVNLHRLLQILAENQEKPWQSEFTVDARWLVNRLNLGRLGRKSKAEQIKEVINRLTALQRIQISIYWIDNTVQPPLSTSNLWHFEITAKWEAGQHSKADIPYTYTIQVQPGKWAHQCKAEVNRYRNLLWVGCQPKDCLRKRFSLKSQLEAVYYQLQQDEFTVYDWLVRARSRPKIEQLLSDRYSKKDLKKAFEAAVLDLREALKPSFDIKPHPTSWLHNQVVKKRPKVKPTSISEQIRKLRLKEGLTQLQVAQMTGYHRSRISQLEKGLSLSDDATERVKSALSQLADQNINTTSVKS